MGQIKSDVAGRHLNNFPNERDYLLPFLANFDVNWAKRIKKGGTEFSVYFIEPDQTIRDQFGIENEVLLVSSDFKTIQNRMMQLVDDFLREAPARGRVDSTTVFLVSRDENVRDWVENYAAMTPQNRVTISIPRQELLDAKSDPWFLRRQLSEQLFSRDLFDDQLPIKSDTFFFGRTAIAAELNTSIKLGQNRGVFGLRKTGKTSLLYKVRRMARSEGVLVLYYDCKDPAIRNQRWDAFLEEIISDLEVASKKKAPSTGHVSKRFRLLVDEIAKKSRIALIFDEIEWVSPVAKIDKHWHQDFVPFWQTMWSTQSEVRKLAFLIAGVNPTVTELAEVDDVQNPLFGIISPTFLTGFSEAEVRQMLGKFGKRMGLKFSYDAAMYMSERYGGHPLLTRMAASFTNSKVKADDEKRPFNLNRAYLELSDVERDAEVMYYCPHVVSELKNFYPDEYQMLEWLVSGNEADFYDFSQGGKEIKHLIDYGVVKALDSGGFEIGIPVLARYVVSQRDDGSGDWSGFYVVPVDQRAGWLRNRIERIGSDIRRLDRLGARAGKPELFGSNGFPEAELFYQIDLVESRAGLEAFLNQMNKSFVEAIERRGKELGKKDYFWTEVRQEYPDLWEALARAKIYRHDAMHLELNQRSAQLLAKMHKKDFDDKDYRKLGHGNFLVQQKVLDGMFLGTVVEMDRLL